MADLTLNFTSVTNLKPADSDCIGGKMAGANITAGMILTVRSDNNLYPYTTGTDAIVSGVAPGTAYAGGPCSNWRGQRFGCTAVTTGTTTVVPLTPGTALYPGSAANPGSVSLTATNSAAPVAFVWDVNANAGMRVQFLV